MPRDLPTPPPERLFLPGSAGRLAATWEVPAAQPLGLVLHLHPHPIHGGTRQNNVVRYGALGSLAAGCAALRIDFRGVGDSEGEYDEGRGEVDDAEAAFRWLQSRHPGLPVFIWGFSFGSRVGLDAAIRLHAEVAGFLAVAWPTNFYAWPTADGWPSRSAFLYGSADQYVDPAKLEHARQRGAAIEVIDGAEHFFAGRLEVVREWTTQFLSEWLSTKNRA